MDKHTKKLNEAFKPYQPTEETKLNEIYSYIQSMDSGLQRVLNFALKLRDERGSQCDPIFGDPEDMKRYGISYDTDERVQILMFLLDKHLYKGK